MLDLSTTWLGLSLRSPLVVGASPLTDDLDALRACCEAGAGAVVMRSLFEEQLVAEQLAAHRFIDAHVDIDAEARSFLPESQIFSMGSEAYVSRMKTLRASLGVPVIASLNGTTPGGWTNYARELADAGADAIEINLYDIATCPSESGSSLEAKQLEVVRSVVRSVTIPVSVKLSPFYSSVPAFVRNLEREGARGVVLFNRFYQPDINLEALELSREVHLSTSTELPLRLHSLAVLSGHTTLELTASGGIHTGDDAAKAILSGAGAVQVVSAVLRDGPQAIRSIRDGLVARLALMGYQTLAQAQGIMSLRNAPNPHTWERLNYVRHLQGWQSKGNPQ